MDGFTQNLPAGLADPLHILPPWTFMALAIAFAILLLAVLIWAAAYYISKRLRRRTKPLPEPAIPYQGDTIGRAIEGIRRNHARSGNYREGCHALSAVVKTHIEKQTGLDIEEMTPDEISRALKSDAGCFFRDLSLLQFGRAAPGEKGFFKICDQSKKIVKTGHAVRRR